MMHRAILGSARRRGLAPPRTVLMWVVVALLVALVLYAVAPQILPVRIYEGPMVQVPTETSVTLVWYTTRPAACTVTITTPAGSRTLQATTDGLRQHVRIDGLEPDSDYPYQIRTGARQLTDGLVFRTNRTADQPFSFFVFGDSGKGSRNQYALAADMLRLKPIPDFLLHTGDMVYPDGARERYHDRFFTPYRSLLPRMAFWPCLGNHDIQEDGTAPAAQEVFELPDNGPAAIKTGFNYWFDYANCRVAVIDSNLDEAVLEQTIAPWLADVLSDEAPRWKIVALHHPPYTGGKYAPDERIQKTLVPVMEAGGVDLVFNGHDHDYQRSRPLRGGAVVQPGEGIVYIVTGAGGAALYEPRGELPPYIAAAEFKQHSFTQVEIDGDELVLHQIGAGGQELDRLVMQKPPLTDSAPATQPQDAP